MTNDGSKVKGQWSDALLLYAPQDQYLYVKKCECGGKIEYVCYQTILCKSDAGAQRCTSGVQVQNEICTRKKNGHTLHASHQRIYDDLVTRHKINDACIAFKEQCEDLGMSVPAKQIFIREMAKLVCRFIH